jgi:hypothetical protein
VHVEFDFETIPANRKTQSFKFRHKLCYFVPDWDTTAFKHSLHSTLHAEPIACRFQCRSNPCKSQNAIFLISTKTLLFRSGLRYYGVLKLFPLYSTRRMLCTSISASKQALQIAKRNLSNIDESSLMSLRIEIIWHLNSLSTPFYTPNLMHVDFSIETIPANRNTQSFKVRRKFCFSIRIEILRRSKALSTLFYTPNVVHVYFSVETSAGNSKTQSFKFLRNHCHLVPDWDIAAFKLSFHPILPAEPIACRFQCPNDH